jgi:hypothetical protein
MSLTHLFFIRVYCDYFFILIYHDKSLYLKGFIRKQYIPKYSIDNPVMGLVAVH